MHNNQSKIAIVTGAGSGIGRAAATALLDNGYRVGLIGRRLAALEETAAGNPDALPLSCDVTDPAAVDAAFSSVKREWGRLDVLFNNAGMSKPPRLIDDMPLEDWYEVLAVNLTGSVICARAAFAIMRGQSPQGGRIINNGSISAYVPRPGSVPYSVTKHGITGLTRTLSLDGRPFNIACGQIDIGNASTDMVDAMRKGIIQADGSTRVEPVMDVQQVADAVVHMASLPLEANIQFMTIMATNMPFIGRG
ncbi:SDR family oxidoreductase [Hoeflea sp. CAU 1731]